MAVLAKRIQDRDIGRDLVSRAGFRKPDLEWLVVGMRRRGADKVLEMHRRIRPVAGHVAHRIHQAARPTTVKMGAALLLQHRPQVIGLIGIAIVVMQHDLAFELGFANSSRNAIADGVRVK